MIEENVKKLEESSERMDKTYKELKEFAAEYWKKEKEKIMGQKYKNGWLVREEE
ncbi:MAG: hypothetical protein DDT23_01312 [candidate division WS2 bacterium]|nr:hypothetical protein [Candidatus Lithacetigena glycinireducens]